jgi:hypothetical protein
LATWHLAQLNVGRAVARLDDPVMAGFVARLAEINALAERSPGFVWRLKGAGGSSSELQLTDDPLLLVNLTVWASAEALFDFTYRSDHRAVLKRRLDWFERREGPAVVLWWQPAGVIPSADEAFRRLARREALGPTPEAFTFKDRFPPPD